MNDPSDVRDTTVFTSKGIRTALVGAGYIADFHARALNQIKGVQLVAVCDTNLMRARGFAAAWNIPETFATLDLMLEQSNINCVHILTAPNSHFSLATAALQRGVHVFLEKPMCVSVAECEKLVQLAKRQGLYLGVNHNFLFASAFEKLRAIVHSKQLGLIDHIAINHFFELPQIRFGPFDNWMLRDPGNVILETGPHIVSALLDLVGQFEILSVTADRKITLPNSSSLFRRWRIMGNADRTAIEFNINFGPGFPQRTIYVRGLFGSAMLDFDADTCVIDQRTPLDIDFDRFKRSRQMARQMTRQARSVISGYALGKLKLTNQGNPYQNSIGASTAAFYSAIGASKPLDERIDADMGRNVIANCDAIVSAAGVIQSAPRNATTQTVAACKPSILVLGGAGFIGKELVRHLLVAGYSIRVMVRGPALPTEEFQNERLEVIHGDISSRTDLDRAMKNIEFVFNLAHAQARTWQDYQTNVIEPTRLVGEACLAAQVKRLVYTGTIDSYYAGSRAGTITERTGLDPDIGRRNYYARAKAAAEELLSDMSRRKSLPLVILRPGIVIGRGGNPFHWGVGRFSDNVCEVWGDGLNKLPFVLVSDVAAALVKAIEIPEIEGKSFNLIDLPLLTARDYLDDLQQRGDIKLAVHYQPIWRFYFLDLAKWLVKILVKHPDGERTPSYSDWESRTQKAHFDCTSARSELGWNPASDRKRLLDEGIGAALQPWLEATR